MFHKTNALMQYLDNLFRQLHEPEVATYMDKR